MAFTSGKQKIRSILLVLLVCFLLIQFHRPELPNQKISETDIQLPDEVTSILKRSCYDCHSNQTDLKWFDQIAPASWLVENHVRKGKEGLNFSKWDQLPMAVQKAKLWASFNQIMLGAMPIKSYVRMHPEAKLSQNDIVILKNYITSLAPKQAPDAAKIASFENQYKELQVENKLPANDLPVSINGITYIPDYKNWTPVSSTERFDNGTIRIIYGNETAIKAIKANKTNPWPNGTILAKVAWDQLIDSSGNSTPGAFKQVEYMIKDSRKYSATKGWGWARFLSTKLEPYGKNLLFTTECINCHRPMKDKDFVFTTPNAN